MADVNNPIQLHISESVAAILKQRHIVEDDLVPVIEEAETTGKKLCSADGKKYLAKRLLGEVTFYAVYSSSPDGYIVHTAYSHRSRLVEG